MGFQLGLKQVWQGRHLTLVLVTVTQHRVHAAGQQAIFLCWPPLMQVLQHVVDQPE